MSSVNEASPLQVWEFKCEPITHVRSWVATYTCHPGAGERTEAETLFQRARWMTPEEQYQRLTDLCAHVKTRATHITHTYIHSVDIRTQAYTHIYR